MAQKEIYRLNIKIGVDGDGEAKRKLTATEKMAEQTKKKMQALNKINANPTAKLNDQASSKLDKLDSKVNKFKSASMTLTSKVKDNASSVVDKIENKTKKIKEANVKVKAKDETNSTIGKIENKINGWVKSGAKKVISLGIAGTMALGGLGIGSSLKTYSEYEKGLSNVKAVTGANVKEMKQLDSVAKKYGATTAWSARHVTQAEELLGQAGFSVGETISALPGLLDLASAGDLDLASATDIASGTLRAFNIDASKTGHVADVLALSASATNSDVADLGETMKYCAPVSQALGISLEDTAAAAGLLSNANIKGSQSGTVLRAIFARLASPTKESAKLMNKYGINAFDAQGKMKPLSAVVDTLNSSLGKLTSQQRADVISNIFGVEAMSGVLALMNQGGQSVSDLSKKLKESNGSAKEMADTKLDNLNGQWIRLKAAVEHAQITLGERLAPYAKEFVTWLTGKMPAITDGIVNLVDYISKNTTTIKSLAGTVLGLGVAFSTLSAIGGIGNTIAGVKSLLGAFKGAAVVGETAAIAGGLKEIGILGSVLPAIFNPVGLAIAGTAILAGVAITSNANLMKKTLSTTTEELGPVEKVMNKLNGSIYKSKAEMQKLGLVYEDFSDNISDNFKKKVEESTKSVHEFQFYLNKINLDGVISDSESAEFDNKINDMFQSAVDTINQNKEKYQTSMKQMFMDDGNFSEAEQATLDYLSKNYDNQITAEEKLKNDIYNIKKKAVEQHRQLNDEDLKNLKEYQAQMVQIQLESAGGTAEEMLYTKNKLKARLEKADLKDSSAILQEARKDIDSRVVEVKAKYDTNLDKLKADLANPDYKGDRSKLKQTIEQNTKAKEDKLSKLNKEWGSYLNEAYKTNSQLEGNINRYDGSILKGGDKRSQKSLEKMKSDYKDLNKITQDGFYGLKDSTTGALSDLYVTVDKTTGEITGAWNTTSGQLGGYTSEISQKVRELGSAHKDTSGEAIHALIAMQATVDTTSNVVKNSFGIAVGELNNVTVAADRTRTGILNIGDKHIEITSNADGQIINMQYLKGSVDNIPPNANVQINTNANQAQGEVGGLIGTLSNLCGRAWNAIITVTKRGDLTLKKPGEEATGTNYFAGGFSTVDERGWELSDRKTVPILGSYNSNPLTYMSRGTKILNHMQSVNDMKEEVSRQVNQKIANQPKQIQYQLVKPQQQLQFAGVGVPSLKIDSIEIDNSFSNGSETDFETLVDKAVQQVAYKLKESLRNIKR